MRLGVQVSWPLVLPAPGVNDAPPGKPDAVSDAIGSPSGSDAVTVTVSAVFSRPLTLAGALTTGGCGVETVTYSYAPRSENVTGPAPVSDVEGSSTRAAPSASSDGQFATPELPESMAGEPPSRWKSPPDAFTNLGSAWVEWASCPLAA